MKMRDISDFLPEGTQVASPGGLSLIPQLITAIEAYTVHQSPTTGPRIVIHMSGTRGGA